MANSWFQMHLLCHDTGHPAYRSFFLQVCISIQAQQIWQPWHDKNSRKSHGHTEQIHQRGRPILQCCSTSFDMVAHSWTLPNMRVMGQICVDGTNMIDALDNGAPNSTIPNWGHQVGWTKTQLSCMALHSNVSSCGCTTLTLIGHMMIFYYCLMTSQQTSISSFTVPK